MICENRDSYPSYHHFLDFSGFLGKRWSRMIRKKFGGGRRCGKLRETDNEIEKTNPVQIVHDKILWDNLIQW